MTTPTAYAYQWKRNGTAISGASASTYPLVTADQGDTITCVVTGSNTAGSASVTTAATPTIGASTGGAPVFPNVPATQRSFAMVGANSLAAMQAGAPHVNEVILQANWSDMQPSGPGTALSSSAVSAFTGWFSDAATAGVDIILEIAFHYAPGWVTSDVEKFTDQVGNKWTGSEGAGNGVANWQWTALGRQYTTDFITKMSNALSSSQKSQVTHFRLGGGCYGETHYPGSPASGSSPTQTNSWYAFGSAQQSGTGLASGLAQCPLVGYVPFVGGGGHAQSTANDNTWLAWYMTGLTGFVQYCNTTLLGLGWNTQRMMVMHPGYGVRTNQNSSQQDYLQSAAAGENADVTMASYQNNTNMWPWCTWIDGTDSSPSPTDGNDTDFAQWKEIYTLAVKYGKENYVRGENTSDSSPQSVLTYILDNALALNEPSSHYPQNVTSSTWQGYKGLMWLDYGELSGGGPLTMAEYVSAIESFYASGATPP